LWLAFTHPIVALIVLAIATLSMVAIIALLMRFLRGLIARFRRRDGEVGPAL